MRLAGIAGLVAMLVFVLPASAGFDETALERQVRTYLEPNQRYQQMFGLPDDASLGRVFCGRAGLKDDLTCLITGSGRYLVTRAPHRAFYFYPCSRFQAQRDIAYNYENDPCADEIDRG